MDNNHDQNGSNFSYSYGALQAETKHITTKELFWRSNQFQDWINGLNALVSPWFASKEQYLLSHI